MSLLSFSRLGAQDFFNAGVTAQTAARAAIYLPGSDNALDALCLNPAGLSFLKGPVLNLETLGTLARGNFSNASNTSSPMRSNAGLLPYGAFGLPLTGRWTVAAGFMPDLLSSAKWQYRDTPGVAGATYGQENETSRILGFRSSLGVSYRVSSHVSVGAEVSILYNSNTLIAPYIFQSNPSLKGLKTLLDLQTSGVGWNNNFGVIATPSRRWQAGASFRTSSSITSNGTAAGNMGAQFAALGIPFRPDFAYRAQVKVQLPRSALFTLAWQQSSVLRFAVQSDWTNWHRSFKNLPVFLSNGTNADINSFLGSNAIHDLIPLQWKDQFAFRGAVERQIGESSSVSGGFVHRTNPVPSSTLTPLTAAVFDNALTAGAGYRLHRVRFDLGYQINLTAQQSVGTSGLLSGEFNNSRVRVGTQALTLGATFRLFQ